MPQNQQACVCGKRAAANLKSARAVKARAAAKCVQMRRGRWGAAKAKCVRVKRVAGKVCRATKVNPWVRRVQRAW